MDEGAWWVAVNGVPQSRTRLSDFTFTFHFPALEKEMATHSSPGSSIHGIFQAGVLEWGAIAFSILACEMTAVVW